MKTDTDVPPWSVIIDPYLAIIDPHNGHIHAVIPNKWRLLNDTWKERGLNKALGLLMASPSSHVIGP